MLQYYKDGNRAQRLDAYMDSISTKDYEYTHLANLAFLCEPELASRVDYKKMTKAILYALSFALYFGKRNVIIPGFGRIDSEYLEHRDRAPEVHRRRQKWRWRLKTRMNRYMGQNHSDLVRHMKDAKRMYFIEPRNYKQESYDLFEDKLLNYWGVDIPTYMEIPRDERRRMRIEMYTYFHQQARERKEAMRQEFVEAQKKKTEV
jgi:hypothetical protein